jgi:hypothetical protein
MEQMRTEHTSVIDLIVLLGHREFDGRSVSDAFHREGNESIE